MGKASDNIKIREAVYEIVKKIPKGRVATYGQISRIMNNELRIMGDQKKVNPRFIGYLLHKNPDPVNIPCHRVVDRNGKLAENFAFGGWKGQKKKLLEEGVKFRDLPALQRRVNRRQGEKHVDKKFISSFL